ncbi:hypothetical protein JCM10450v2_007777 [Rhodotorula kratochvilovae]
MARFGLVDSDDDSSASSHSQPSCNASPSSSPPPRSPRSDADDSDGLDDDDAPPRESIHDDHMDSLSDQDEDDSGDDEEDLSLDDDTAQSLNQSRASSMGASRSRSARTRSRSYSRQLDSDDDDLSLHSGTPSPPRPRRALPAAHSATPQPAWSTKGKLRAGVEPKRVAVMQASLFRQGDLDDDDAARQRDDDDLRRADEREKKRRAVEAGLASRAVPQPAPTAAAPSSAPLPATDPAPFRPHRTFARTPLAQSVTNGREGNLVDAGLAHGRGFRVGWGKGGEVISLKGVYPEARKEETGSASLRVEKLRLLANDDAEPALRLLKLQLAHTDIFPPSEDGAAPSAAPIAAPSPDLRFSHYAELFTALSDADKTSAESQLFKLASALFDEIPDLALPTVSDDGAPLTPQQAAYITSLRRRAQLSAWLEESALAPVEAALRSLPASTSGAARVFALLSGHQIERACDAALEAGNLRLATLLAQAGSATSPPDAAFQADLFLQLSKWREYGADAPALLDPAYRRVLELLSGNTGVVPGHRAQAGEDDVPELHVLDGLSWTQALAAGLWYAPDPASGGPDEAVRAAVEAYERAFGADERVAPPVPGYLSRGGESAWAPLPGEKRDPPRDAAFHLVKLAVSPVHALEAALAPRNFGPSPTDYRLPWHLYVLLSRVLRRRDWEDREVLEAEEAAKGAEASSETADRVTEAYAAQLEMLGLWEWAAFVLLHVELEERRIYDIKALLSRHVDALAASDSPQATFLTTTLHIPSVWLSSALADSALSRPSQRFEAYKLLLAAQRVPEAHFLAWTELAPEALLRADAALVRRLLAPFHAEADPGSGLVSGWEREGGVYLSYLAVLDAAQDALSAPGGARAFGTALAARLSEVLASVQQFVHRARTEKRYNGNQTLRVAGEEMRSRLVVLAKAAAASVAVGGGAALERTQPSLLPESERAVWIQGANRAFWEASVARA